jgi:hypothetical protein
MEQKKKYPKGFFMSTGIAVGIPIGLAISIALDNFAFIGIGVAVGISIGIALESSYQDKGLIKKSGKPIQKRNKQLLYLFFSGTVLLTALLIYYFLSNA